MDGRIAYDATAYINNAIHEVMKTLGDTLLIVMVIIFLFLGSFRSVLIPVIAIPLSLIGAVFLMQVFGFTINLLTLLAIVLSVGLVVDDAIVVVENVERHLSEGQSPLDAALMGARELVGPIIAMTVTLAAVYAPIGLQGGLTGALFREFAFTLAGAVTISGVVALTLSPVMSAMLLKPGLTDRGLAGKISRDFKRFRAFYGRLLDVTLNYRPAVYLVWIVVSLLTIPMFTMSPVELAPAEDQGVIFGILDGAANSTIDQNSIYAAAVNKAYLSIKETDFTFQITRPTSGICRHGRQTLVRAGSHDFSDSSRSSAEAACHYGHSGVSGHPAGASRRGPVSGGIHPGVNGGTGPDPAICAADPDKGHAKRHVRLSAAHRCQDRPAPVRADRRPRQGRQPRHQSGTGGRGYGDHAGR